MLWQSSLNLFTVKDNSGYLSYPNLLLLSGPGKLIFKILRSFLLTCKSSGSKFLTIGLISSLIIFFKVASSNVLNVSGTSASSSATDLNSILNLMEHQNPFLLLSYFYEYIQEY